MVPVFLKLPELMALTHMVLEGAVAGPRTHGRYKCKFCNSGHHQWWLWYGTEHAIPQQPQLTDDLTLDS
jgi:hypothetical protein